MTLKFPFSNRIQDYAEEEEDVDKLKKKCEVWWGLSDSSTNLAKELLPTEFVSAGPSKDMATTASTGDEKVEGVTSFDGAVAAPSGSTKESSNEREEEPEAEMTVNNVGKDVSYI